jgi:uncharacterized membrane protein YidH (DUF202 family)
MITRYSDHAANERTFLAWVRTAIAMMAFGFVIGRRIPADIVGASAVIAERV